MFDPRTLEAIDWPEVEYQLDQDGCAIVRSLLSTDDCTAVSALYTHSAPFRSRVIMARHGFGRGEYQYFNYPLPQLVAGLRSSIYPLLVPVANRWQEQMNLLGAFLKHTKHLLSVAMPPVRNDPRRCCCNTVRRITTACTRTCTASRYFRCRWRFSFLHRMKTLPAENSFSPNNGRACNRAPR